MNSLTRFDQNGLELVIDTQTGESFASISASARIVERNESTIRSYCSSRNFELKEAQTPTATGLRSSRLLNEEQLVELVSHYNPEKIKLFAKAGIRMYLHSLAGYKVKSTAVEQPKVNPALTAAKEVREITDTLFDNPRLAQLLIDSTVNYHIGEQLLEGSQPRLRGVVEIAEDMGFKTDMSSRVRLGKFVKAQIPHLAQLEERICNGQMRAINCYPDCDEVKKIIKAFFN